MVKTDALSSIQFAQARDPLNRLIAGSPLSDRDVIALARLNSFCVVRWYEPMVTLLDKPFIELGVADFLEPLLPKLSANATGVTWSQ